VYNNLIFCLAKLFLKSLESFAQPSFPWGSMKRPARKPFTDATKYLFVTANCSSAKILAPCGFPAM